MSNHPPRVAAFLLKRLLDGNINHLALGDLEEQFHSIQKKHGLLYAHFYYWLQILPVLKNIISKNLSGSIIMLKSYIKTAFRYIFRKKLFAAINILGLTAGIACFILISIWAQDEMSFDKFHQNKDNLYLLTIIHPNDAVDWNVPYALAPTLSDQYPEIKDYTRIYTLASLRTCSFKYQPEAGPQVLFYEDNVNLVDPGFFTIFSFPFIYGSPETALAEQNALVLREEVARKYFGTENPLGKKLTLNNQADLIVAGVVRVPKNSHIQFDFITRLNNTLADDWNWRDSSFVLLDEQASSQVFRTKIAGSLNKYYPSPLPGTFKVDILPITKVHLNFGRSTYVYIFSLIAVFILFIACVNYMNLATASSSKRAREIGLRKVVGAKRTQLIFQFLGESVLLSTLALFLALFVVQLTLPVLNSLTGKQLVLFPFQNVLMYPFLMGLAILVGIISGSYPALYLTSSKPIETLRGAIGFRPHRSKFRVISVVGQFTISVLLIACTIVVLKQLNYVRHKSLGFNTDYVLKIPFNNSLKRRYPSFKTDLLQNPNILKVSASQAVPYDEDYKTSGVKWDTQAADMVPNVRYSICDFDYLELYDMEIVAGRSFAREFSGDQNNFIINETAAEYMEMEEPLGQRLTFWGREGLIIGVVKDFHHVSLHREIMPQYFTINPRLRNALKYISVKVNSINLPDTIKFIQTTAKQISPDYPFAYSFLDQGIGNLYQTEQRLGKIFSYFAFLAIFISCLGIFGLAAFTAEQRTKEIGIRKILGCSVPGIMLLLTRAFSRWVLLANLIAWPIAYYIMLKWLQNFAYRTGFSPLIFLLAGSISLVIAALPIGYQALKAAAADPVDSLRYE